MTCARVYYVFTARAQQKTRLERKIVQRFSLSAHTDFFFTPGSSSRCVPLVSPQVISKALGYSEALVLARARSQPTRDFRTHHFTINPGPNVCRAHQKPPN